LGRREKRKKRHGIALFDVGGEIEILAATTYESTEKKADHEEAPRERLHADSSLTFDNKRLHHGVTLKNVSTTRHFLFRISCDLRQHRWRILDHLKSIDRLIDRGTLDFRWAK
jgi:hypothetical protein